MNNEQRKEKWLAIYKDCLETLETQSDNKSPGEGEQPFSLTGDQVNSIMFVLSQHIKRLEALS